MFFKCALKWRNCNGSGRNWLCRWKCFHLKPHITHSFYFFLVSRNYHAILLKSDLLLLVPYWKEKTSNIKNRPENWLIKNLAKFTNICRPSSFGTFYMRLGIFACFILLQKSQVKIWFNYKIFWNRKKVMTGELGHNLAERFYYRAIFFKYQSCLRWTRTMLITKSYIEI